MPPLKHLCSALCVLVATTFATHAEDLRLLTVTGEGRVSSAPDMATVNLGVQRDARDAGAAMAAASDAAAAVLATLEEAGIEARDIQTTRIGLDPRYARQADNSPPRITGYIASNDLSVHVRDLAVLGSVLDAVVAEGANSFRGLSFGVSDSTALSDAAREAAVKDAAARAQTLAEAAGITLGPIQSMAEGGGAVVPQPMMRGAMMAEAAVPVAQGEIDVTARVTIVYAIAD